MRAVELPVVVLLVGEVAPQTLRSVALRLAGHLTHSGASVAVLEADFHGSGWRVARDKEFGLGPALEDDDGRDPDAVDVETSSHNGSGPGLISVMLRGKTHSDPGVSLASDRFLSLLGRLVEQYDSVLVVGPPTEFQAEVYALAEAADGVVLLVPPWIPRSHAASMTALRSVDGDARLLVSVFGEPEAMPLAPALDKARDAPRR